jgi:hypothetical protein
MFAAVVDRLPRDLFGGGGSTRALLRVAGAGR